MPSKKKQSRTPSRLSNSEPPSSPRTPTSSATSRDTDYVNEEELRRGIEEASAAFPCLIGKSAIIGRVADVASESIRGSKIWLSESSMVSACLIPGSTVSVSLACTERHSFPLSSIKAEYGVKCESSLADDEPGNYFVLATVLPSSKVSKDSVRISVNLRYGLGCPVSGRTVFVYPVSRPSSLSDQFQGNGGSLENDVNDLSLLACKELCLELTPFRNMSPAENEIVYKEKLALESSHEQNGNGNPTPKTPSNFQKLSSPASSVKGDSVLSFNQQFSSESLVDLREVLSNESSKKLLQICAASWLYPCSLLYGSFVAVPILSETCIFCVKRANKKALHTSNRNHVYVINRETKVYLYPTLGLSSEIGEGTSVQGLQFDDDDEEENMGCEISKLGGLSKEYAILRDIIVSSSTKSSLSSLGLRPTKGVLIHGPPGTGKTTLARSFARDSGVNFFSVNGAEIIRQYLGESEKALEEVFRSASNAAPAVVFIDDLDAIAPAREEGGEELSQRMVATLLNLMDGISRSDGVVVIAATNRPNSIEPALRRPGRLDREIEIGVPSSAQRLDILQTILSGMRHSLSDTQLEQLAVGTHGFVGADLAALCCEAAFVCLRKHLDQESSSSSLPLEETHMTTSECRGSESVTNMTDVSSDCSDSASSCITVSPSTSVARDSFSLNGTVSVVEDNFKNSGNSCSEQMLDKEEHTLSVGFEDFEKAKIKIRPSAMREVILEVPKVNWEDVGGQNEVKSQLMEAVEWPQKHQDAFKRIGTKPPSGILMFGPPGCSKTLMARAVASEAGLNFLAVKGPELFSKWVGESEKAVRSLFAKARANAPSIIFFDEIDSLASIRGKEKDGVSVSDRVMSQLLVELDGLHQRVGVTVIAATNRPDKIDSALLRPGRFDRLLYVGPPNEADREAILKIHLRKIPCSSDICLKELASITKGYTGADISLICREAAIAALEESLEAEEISMRHLKAAISQVEPTDIQSYKALSEKFQRLVHTDPQGDNEVEQQGNKSQRSSAPLWTPFKSIVMFFRRQIGS